MYQQLGANALSANPARSSSAAPRDEAGALIARYPDLSDVELARLIDLYRGFSSLDAAMIISNDSLAPNLERFTADHRRRIRTPFRQYAALVGYAVLAVIGVAWAAAASA